MFHIPVILIYSFTAIYFADCKVCTIDGNSTAFRIDYASNSTNSPDDYPKEFVCPATGDPDSFTECCVGSSKCCPPERRFYEIDSRLAMILAASVISGCAVVATVVILCCFWSKCPMYNTCKSRYTESDIIAYEKSPSSMEMNGMPAEPSTEGQHIFTPSNQNKGAAAI